MTREIRRSPAIVLHPPKIRLLICSANLGNACPTAECLEAFIPKDGLITKSREKDEIGKQYDMIVVGLQESAFSSSSEQQQQQSVEKDDKSLFESMNSVESSLVVKNNNNRLTLKDTLRSFTAEEDELQLDKTLGTSIISSLVSRRCPSYDALVNCLKGQMRMIILVLKKLTQEISNVEYRFKATGVGNVLANKGGIIATLTLRKTRLAFITAHLAAHEGTMNYMERCNNLASILSKSCSMRDSNGLDVSLSAHHCFVFGDLNYRLTPHNNSNNDYSEKDKFTAHVLQLISDKSYEALSQYDELLYALENNHCLVNFKTPPCHFNPTFKVKRNKIGYHYLTKRIPSYTDRILYKSAHDLHNSSLLLTYYGPCEDYISSDHKPIQGSFTIHTNDSPFSHKPEHSARAISTTNRGPINRRMNLNSSYEMISTNDSETTCKVTIEIFVSDISCQLTKSNNTNTAPSPYLAVSVSPLTLLFDPRYSADEALQFQTNTNDNINAFNPSISQNFYISTNKARAIYQTYNPTWGEDIDEIHFSLDKISPIDLRGSMIFISVIDLVDNSIIGSTSINLFELCRFIIPSLTSAIEDCSTFDINQFYTNNDDDSNEDEDDAVDNHDDDSIVGLTEEKIENYSLVKNGKEYGKISCIITSWCKDIIDDSLCSTILNKSKFNLRNDQDSRKNSTTTAFRIRSDIKSKICNIRHRFQKKGTK